MKSFATVQAGLCASIVLVVLSCSPGVKAETAGYIRVLTSKGPIAGESQDPAHMSWISIRSVVAGDLNGDAKADREASEPSVSEVTATPASMAANTGKGSSGKSTANSSAAHAQAASEPRDAAAGMSAGKRMHKPLVITKEIDKASPKLFEACASGQHLKEVDVDLAGGSQY